jgi:hypothetical protein
MSSDELLERCFPAEWTVRKARDAYLAENGFSAGAYDDKWTEGSIFGLRVAVPNTRHHRWSIMLHDLDHVATGYGTDLVGEGEISVWELRHVRDLGPYVGALVSIGAIAGVLFAPRRALDAWRHAARTASLYALHPRTDEAAYERLLDLTVGELRSLLGVPAHGLARVPRRLHEYAPSATRARGSP